MEYLSVIILIFTNHTLKYSHQAPLIDRVIALH